MIQVKPEGWLAWLADMLMVPIMYLVHALSGAFGETPQRGHRWNKAIISLEEAGRFDKKMMVCLKGKKDLVLCSRILIHIPFLSGWRHYIVLRPDFDAEWYVGWVLPARAAFRRVQLDGPVRLLLGPEDVCFFGLNRNGEQIQLWQTGEGKIGDKRFSHLPLL